MKVLALVQGPDHVCYRYRIGAFAWALAERGLTLQVEPLRRPTLRRTRQLLAAGRADVVILQRKLLPLWQLQVLRHATPRLVYDVDDAVFLRDSYSRKPETSIARLARFWATVYAADAVITGNDYLKERVSGYVGPERVHVIPTCVEPKRYPLARHHRRGSAVKLAWIGQQSTLRSLERAAANLAAAAARLPGVELRVISDSAVRLPGVRSVLRPWSSATEAAELADADVGICWLPDDQWSRGKCGLKVLQYMAAGLPVVANPVGMNSRLVVHGRTGMLASSPAEWAAALSRLAADPWRRVRLGGAGRRLVERQYSAARWGPKFARLIASVAGSTPCRPSPGRNAPETAPTVSLDLVRQAVAGSPP